jgi:hypothetical protein
MLNAQTAQIKVHATGGINIGGSNLTDPTTGKIQLYDNWTIIPTAATDLKFATSAAGTTNYLNLNMGTNLTLNTDKPLIVFGKSIQLPNSWKMVGTSATAFTIDGGSGDLTVGTGTNLTLNTDKPLIEFLKPIQLPNLWGLNTTTSSFTFNHQYGSLTLTTSDYINSIYKISTSMNYLQFDKPLTRLALKNTWNLTPTSATAFTIDGGSGDLILNTAATNSLSLSTDKTYFNFSNSIKAESFKLQFSDNGYSGYLTLSSGPNPYLGFNTDKANFQFNKPINVTDKVSIGTTSTVRTLNVNGTAGFGSITDGVVITNNTGSSSIVGIDIVGTAYNDLDIRAKSDVGSQLYLRSDGIVSIATNAGYEKLTVHGNISVSNEITFAPQVNGTSNGYINYDGYLGENTQFRNLWIGNGKRSNVMFVDGVNSRVGVGTTTPSATLDVNGIIKGNNTLSLYNGSTENVRITNTGYGYFDKDIVGNSTMVSDERLKENIQPLIGSLEKVLQLEGISYNRKKDGTKHLGFVAQKVEYIIPEVVIEKVLPLENEDEILYKTINYSEIIPHLVEAIKEQQVQIDALEKRIEKLEKK